MAELLFIYGTLHPDRAPAEIADAARRMEPLGAATIRGRLYDLGAYPGIVLDESAEETVPGELFSVADAETLAQLDAYEGYCAGDPANSLFLRVETDATLRDGTERVCWVYVYNGER